VDLETFQEERHVGSVPIDAVGFAGGLDGGLGGEPGEQGGAGFFEVGARVAAARAVAGDAPLGDVDDLLRLLDQVDHELGKPEAGQILFEFV